jgi:hypothetical protein
MLVMLKYLILIKIISLTKKYGRYWRFSINIWTASLEPPYATNRICNFHCLTSFVGTTRYDGVNFTGIMFHNLEWGWTTPCYWKFTHHCTLTHIDRVNYLCMYMCFSVCTCSYYCNFMNVYVMCASQRLTMSLCAHLSQQKPCWVAMSKVSSSYWPLLLEPFHYNK